MSDPITLCRLGPDDLELLMAVQEGLFDKPVRRDQSEAFLNDPLHEIILAFDGDSAVGMASGQIMLHPDKPPAFFVAEVGVRDSHLRRGIAQQMCAKLLGIARARGCQGIWLATETDNVAARALYRSLDARETGGIVVYDWDGAMDD
jgi:ribosomal protein S18 acetylase RimI-like enzyme